MNSASKLSDEKLRERTRGEFYILLICEQRIDFHEAEVPIRQNTNERPPSIQQSYLPV